MPTPPLPDDREPLYSGTIRGIQWAILLSPIGNSLNGYALIPEGHTIPMGELNAPGGITYGYYSPGGIDDDETCEGWCGFDTGHAHDHWNPAEFREKIGIYISPEALAATNWVEDLMARYVPRGHVIREWTVEDMIEATEDLATQIADHLGA